jgi:hypothetical protein
MKSRIRSFIAAGAALALCACANPYADQLARLDARYAAGKISRREYRNERDYLEVQKSRVDRENLRTGLAAAAIGTAIAGTVVASQQSRGPSGPGRSAGPGGGGGGPSGGPPR